MRIRNLLLAASLGTLAVPGAAAAATNVQGVVVSRDARHGELVVAGQSGRLTAVAVGRGAPARTGTRVRLTVRSTGGELVATRVQVLGHARKATLRGTVVRTSGRGYVLSARGATVAIRSAEAGRRIAGEQVETHVDVNGSSLVEQHHGCHVTGDDADRAHLRGTIASLPTAAAPALGLTLADASTVSVAVGTVDLTGLAVGDRVEAKVTVATAADGTVTYTLTKIHKEDAQAPDALRVEVEGVVSALDAATASPRTITLGTAPNTIVFVIPAGFDVGTVAIGDEVEAKGTLVDGKLQLVRLHAEDRGDDHGHHPEPGDDNGGDGGGEGGGHGGHGGDD